ncbi:MAG: PQQ-dependent sugar dehydrogenase [Gammaproteobacteria bacterium]|nr:PQQ-dependent sugar dehydrogenase [Gammaproteobacteria bacterium]
MRLLTESEGLLRPLLITGLLLFGVGGCGGDAQPDDSEGDGVVLESPGEEVTDLDETVVDAEAAVISRPMNKSCLAAGEPTPVATTIALEQPFPHLPHLGMVLGLLQSPGDASQWYAVTQNGRVLQFANRSDVDAFATLIDLSDRIYYQPGSELGLLGMAFHPDYADNGEIFLSYTAANPLRSVISRLVSASGRWQETVILEVPQPYENHNGGNIAFGPDGYLYIGLGDGGSGGDPHGHGQDTSSLLGAMLRIDVDGGTPYAIPEENPFSGYGRCSDSSRDFHNHPCPEIFAWGLRNPWRWSFDRQSGELWAGDVGQNRWEEIDRIRLGGNYGWNILEAESCYLTANCDPNQYEPPLVSYSHEHNDRSVVGGMVYRGSDPQLAPLQGTYLYGDTYSARIWGVRTDGSEVESEQLLAPALQLLYSFAEGLDGAIYLLDPAFSSSGPGQNIYKIVAAASPQPSLAPVPPLSLAESGCVDAEEPTEAAAAMIPYQLNTPLWSDGAEKSRFFALEEGSTIDVDKDGDLLFPVGAVLLKQFYLGEKIVESRLLMHFPSGWRGYSYAWEYDSGGKAIAATLLGDSWDRDLGGGQRWYYPSSTECMECHTNSANIALGPELIQLQREIQLDEGSTIAQLAWLEKMDLFSLPLSTEQQWSPLTALDAEGATDLQRVKSYLHSNCAGCHQPGEVNTATIDLRYQTPLAEMGICDTPPLRGDLGLSEARIVAPGRGGGERSVLVARMESLDSGLRMPPLASGEVDQQAVALIRSWQEGLSECP